MRKEERKRRRSEEDERTSLTENESKPMRRKSGKLKSMKKK